MNATQLLSEIRNGEAVKELSLALADALRSVQDVGKAATVTLKITIDPLTKMKLSEPAVGYSAEITSKPAKPEPDSTVFFIGADGEPSQNPTKQQTLGLQIAGGEKTAAQ